MAVTLGAYKFLLPQEMEIGLPKQSDLDGVSREVAENKPRLVSSRDDERHREHELVKLTAEGNETAYASLVNQNLKQVYAVAKRMLGNDADAEDVSQEVFLKLWKHAGTFESNRAKLSTWLHRITVNLCIDRYRARKHETISDVDEPSIFGEQYRSVQEQQLSVRVEKELMGLPDRQRLAIILFHYEGHSMKSVGEILEVSVEAVESLLARARRKLKEALKSELGALMPQDD